MIPDDLGVVAIGRNEGERLVRCLASVKSELGKIVYVNSGSIDDSVVAAEKMGAHVVKLDISRPFTAARARNEGFTALRDINPNIRYVQFIDGDCTLVPGWLEKARAFISNRGDVAIVCGRRRELNPTASIYNQLCDLEWDSPIGDAVSCGGDSMIRVAAFQAVRGFREQLIAGEEPELCVRIRALGWKIWRLDADMTSHDAAMMRISQFWARTVRGGYAYAEVSHLHSGSPYGIWKRETLRAVFWGGLLPLIICLSASVYPIAFAGALAYGLQICRIASARGPRSSQSWLYAFFITLAKFGEFQGILKYYWHKLIRRNVAIIEYK